MSLVGTCLVSYSVEERRIPGLRRALCVESPQTAENKDETFASYIFETHNK